jgi:hypothetical protein
VVSWLVRLCRSSGGPILANLIVHLFQKVLATLLSFIAVAFARTFSFVGSSTQSSRRSRSAKEWPGAMLRRLVWPAKQIGDTPNQADLISDVRHGAFLFLLTLDLHFNYVADLSINRNLASQVFEPHHDSKRDILNASLPALVCRDCQSVMAITEIPLVS